MKLQDPNGIFNQSGGDLTIAPGSTEQGHL